MALPSPSKKAKASPGRILVTGAGGFLGSHICRHFGKKGWQVAAVGRFHATLSLAESYPNLVILGGMTLPDAAFTRLVAQFQPHLVIHAAGTASVGDSVKEPYGDFQRTVDVCAFTLETLRRHAPGAHFILLSSASIYGNPESLPIGEGAAIKPISPYGFHKVMCEDLVREYQTLHGLTTTCARIFSAYGEGLHKQIVHDLCAKLLVAKERVIELHGTGEESRDFINGKDVAYALEIIHHQKANGIFNLGSGQETTIRDLAQLVIKVLRVDKVIQFNGKVRPGDPLQWRADISALSQLGYVTQISLAQGVKAYASWYQQQAREMSTSESWVPAPAARVYEVHG